MLDAKSSKPSVSGDIDWLPQLAKTNLSVAQMFKEWSDAADEAGEMVKQGRTALIQSMQSLYKVVLYAEHERAEFENLAKQKLRSGYNKTTDCVGLILKMKYGAGQNMRRKVSEHGAVIRLLKSRKVPIEKAAKIIKEWGGIRKCAAKYARQKRASKPNAEIGRQSASKSESISPKKSFTDDWQAMKAKSPTRHYAFKKAGQDDTKLAKGRYLASIYSTPTGELWVYKVIRAKSKRAANLIAAFTSNK